MAGQKQLGVELKEYDYLNRFTQCEDCPRENGCAENCAIEMTIKEDPAKDRDEESYNGLR